MVLSTQLDWLASAWFAVVRRIVNLHQMSDAWILEVVVPLQEPVSVQPNMPFTGHKEETMPGGQNPGDG